MNCEECDIYDDATPTHDGEHDGEHDVQCPACRRWVDTSPAFAKPLAHTLEPLSANLLAKLASLDETPA